MEFRKLSPEEVAKYNISARTFPGLRELNELEVNEGGIIKMPDSKERRNFVARTHYYFNPKRNGKSMRCKTINDELLIVRVK